MADGKDSEGTGAPKPRVSSRTPQTIEGEATPLAPPAPVSPQEPEAVEILDTAAPRHPEATMGASGVDTIAPYAPAEDEAPTPIETGAAQHAPPEPDKPAAPPLERRSRAPLLAGVAAVLLLGGVGYLAWDPDQGAFSSDFPGWRSLTGEPAPQPAKPGPTATSAPPGKPTQTADAPKPAAPAPKPAPDVAKPAPSPEAAKPPGAPATAQAPKPAAEAPKPAAEAPKPAADGPKPVADASKPAAEAPKPAAEAQKPVAEAPKPPAPTAGAPAPAAVPTPVAEAPKPTSASAPDARVADARLADVDRRIGALEARVATLADAKPAPDLAPQLNALSAKTSALETTIAEQAPKISALDAALADRTTKLAALDAAVAERAARLGALEAMAGALDKRLAAIEAALAQPKAEARAPETRDALQAREAEKSAARLVVTQGLAAAVQSGGPIGDQIAALRGLGADDAALGRLSANSSGVPTLAALREGFAALRPKFKPPAPPADANLGDRLMSRFSSLVTVRGADEKPGVAPDAVAGRIEAALQRGDVAGALDQWRTLPPPDQAVSKAWADAAAARLQAEADVRALVAGALGALAKPKS